MNYSLDAGVLQDNSLILPNGKNVILKTHGKSNMLLPAASKEFLERERQDRKLQE
jgi:hypothetical protein